VANEAFVSLFGEDPCQIKSKLGAAEAEMTTMAEQIPIHTESAKDVVKACEETIRTEQANAAFLKYADGAEVITTAQVVDMVKGERSFDLPEEAAKQAIKITCGSDNGECSKQHYHTLWKAIESQIAKVTRDREKAEAEAKLAAEREKRKQEAEERIRKAREAEERRKAAQKEAEEAEAKRQEELKTKAQEWVTSFSTRVEEVEKQVGEFQESMKELVAVVMGSEGGEGATMDEASMKAKAADSSKEGLALQKKVMEIRSSLAAKDKEVPTKDAACYSDWITFSTATGLKLRKAVAGGITRTTAIAKMLPARLELNKELAALQLFSGEVPSSVTNIFDPTIQSTKTLKAMIGDLKKRCTFIADVAYKLKQRITKEAGELVEPIDKDLRPSGLFEDLLTAVAGVKEKMDEVAAEARHWERVAEAGTVLNKEEQDKAAVDRAKARSAAVEAAAASKAGLEKQIDAAQSKVQELAGKAKSRARAK